ncbi:MAG: AbiA family abortive infection protein [Oscillospiraceae bacterium]|nr:AbiA family abortive infection protein [Oscillospiraceae bacterium]
MFGISYSTWESVCNMYFSLKPGFKKACLQWFPFTKLSPNDMDIIAGMDFYNRYIKTASFVLFPQVMHQSENFLQKGDGSFRDSSLVGPILYLVLQAIGMEIHKHYISVRPDDISVYYAGNYEHLRPSYKQDYDDFFREINASTDEYQYFIKTDITNFYSNISLDKLVTQIDTVCNSNGVAFSQTQLQLFKEFLRYCGNERFPLIENSVASSFLSTVVYLDVADKTLYEYISANISEFSSFRIVRYVDDMYILFSSEKPIECLYKAYNEIRNEYSSILKDFGLSLNAKKCCLKELAAVNHELKKSLYDEYFNEQKLDIENLFAGELYHFLRDLKSELLLDSVDIEKYNKLIDDHFSSGDIEFSPSEVFNYYVYEDDKELRSEDVVKEVCDLVGQSISFISLDPKRLTVMIMKTKSDRAIKGFLNQLFVRNRSNRWNSYDTTIAISYLIQSEFRHIDLLDILSDKQPNLYDYYFYYCKNSSLQCFDSWEVKKLSEVISKDVKAHYLYFMYLCEKKRANYMVAFAYYKNFFDRVTADLDFAYGENLKLKKPNYKGFYKEEKIIDFYASIKDSEVVIRTAHKLRNANPLSHSSSELLDSDNTSEDLIKSMKSLSELLYEYISTRKSV